MTQQPHFEGPTMDNDLGRLNEKQITDQIKFTSHANAAFNYVRRNGIPEGYAETIEEYKKANAGPINFEDIYALDQAISQTIYDNDVFGQLGIPTHTMSKPRWELKDYLVTSKEWPRFSKSFQSPVFINIGDDHQFTNGLGMHLGLSIPFTEIRESQGALWGPREVMMQELGAKFGLHKSRKGSLGDTCQNAYFDDGSTLTKGITGLFNNAGNSTFEGGIGGDENMQDQGDVEFTIKAGLRDLKKCYQAGKIVIVSTGGVAEHMYNERDTYTQTLDIKRVKEVISAVMGHGNATWGGWFVTEQLYNTTPSSTAQQMMIMKVAPSLINRHLVYPQQMMPMANKNYEADIQENMIFGDIIQIKKVDTTNNAHPITKNASALTTDGTGWIQDGTRIF